MAAVDECVDCVPRRVYEIHGDLLAIAVAPDDRVVVVNLGSFERRVQVHLEAEHFAEILLGGRRQADAPGQDLVLREQQDRLLHLARDVFVFGIVCIEGQA